MARKRERGNGDGDVWPRRNKEGKIIGYRASYWVDAASGLKRRYVSGKNKSRDARGPEQGQGRQGRRLPLRRRHHSPGEYLDGWLEDTRGTVRQRTWERHE